MSFYIITLRRDKGSLVYLYNLDRVSFCRGSFTQCHSGAYSVILLSHCAVSFCSVILHKDTLQSVFLHSVILQSVILHSVILQSVILHSVILESIIVSFWRVSFFRVSLCKVSFYLMWWRHIEVFVTTNKTYEY